MRDKDNHPHKKTDLQILNHIKKAIITKYGSNIFWHYNLSIILYYFDA